MQIEAVGGERARAASALVWEIAMTAAERAWEETIQEAAVRGRRGGEVERSQSYCSGAARRFRKEVEVNGRDWHLTIAVCGGRGGDPLGGR